MKLMRLFAAAVVTSMLAGCEPPPVFGTSDPRQNRESARIEGEVVVMGRARGDVVVFLFDAARPPPPQGTGRPIAFELISGERVFGQAMGDGSRGGPFTASFGFSLVPEGRYIIRGFIDRQSDFNPWYGVTGEPGADDVGGAAIDALTLAPRVIEITRGVDGALKPVTDAHVMFSDTQTIPVDRPAFKVSGDRVLDLSKPLSLFTLTPETFSSDVLKVERPAFLARYVDDNGDGIPDDANGDGVPDLWPRVVVRKLSDALPPLRDENDQNRDGVVDELGADYARADGTTDGKADLVVLAAGLVPDALVAALTHADGSPILSAVPVPQLTVAIRPMALDARDPNAPMPLKSVPPGRYAIVVIQSTGQTWRVPNELQPDIAQSVGLPSVESQGFVIEVN